MKLTEEQKKLMLEATVKLSLELYKGLIPVMVYDETPPEDVATMAYNCAKAFNLTIPKLVQQDLEDENTTSSTGE